MAIRKIPMDTDYFHYYNANPKNNRAADCVVRALALAMDKTWDEVLDDLTMYAKKYKLMPNETKCYTKYLADEGWVKRNQPRDELTNKKLTGIEFCKELEEGYWTKPIVAHIGTHHIVCFKNYKVWDIWNSSHGCVGVYWERA